MLALSRRQFSLALLASSSVFAAAATMFFEKTNRYLRIGQYRRDKTFRTSKFYAASELSEKVVLQLDLKTHTWTEIPVTSAPHVIETHPTQSQFSLSATQKADTISCVDWTLGRQISEHVLPSGEFFYGHGVFSNDGSSVFASTYRIGRPSSILKFRFPDLVLEERFDIPYGLAHEIVLLDEDHLLFGNSPMGGSDSPGFGVLNVKTKGTHLFPLAGSEHPRLASISHIERLTDGFMGTFHEALSDFDRPSGLATLKGQKVDFRYNPQASGLRSEILSLAYDWKRKLVWATIPTAEKVLIWDETKQEVLTEFSSLSLKTEQTRDAEPFSLRPYGVSHSEKLGRTFVVTQDYVMVLDSESRKVIETIAKPRGGYSAHARLA